MPALLLEVVHEVQHLRPHRHVERGDRFVGHDEVGFERQRAGDGDALELTARELGRIPLHHVAAHADAFEELVHLADALLAIHLEVHDQRFGDRFADRHMRIERAVRILEHHLHAAALRPQVASAERADVDAVEAHRALVGLDQAQHEPTGRGLPRAGLADQGERLPTLEGEADVVDRGDPVGGTPERVALGREPLGEALDLEEAHTFTSGTTMPGNWSSVARRHRTSTSPRRSSGGRIVSHRPRSTCGHRGWKRQPGGAYPGGGTFPGMSTRRRPCPIARDRHRADPTCTGGGASRRRPRPSPAPPPGRRTSPPRVRPSRR